MTSSTDKETQLACLSSLYEAVNETCRAGADVTHSSGPACHEENLSDTETFLCKLAQVCDSKKGGDTITAIACLKSPDGEPEYILSSNARQGSDSNNCVSYLKGLLNYVIENPDDLQLRALRKQILWRILEFNVGRVGVYLQALLETVERCIGSCHEGDYSPVLKYLLTIRERCGFEIDMESTKNSKSLFLRNCENLINIVQSTKAEGFGPILDERANMPGNPYWSQLRHLLGRLNSYRHAADTIVGASKNRRDLFLNFTVTFVSSALPARSLVPQGISLHRLLRTAFPDSTSFAASCGSDIAELENSGLHEQVARLQHRHRNRTTVHCEVLLHGYLHEQGKISPTQFFEDTCFIATSKPPCKLCHVYFAALCGHFRVRASHLNIYPKWRLPDMDDADREEILDDMIEQMQDDTMSLLRDKRALWRRNDSRTDTHAGFQSALGSGMMGSSRSGGVSVRPESAMSMQSQTVSEMPPPRYLQPVSTATSTGGWGLLG